MLRIFESQDNSSLDKNLLKKKKIFQELLSKKDRIKKLQKENGKNKTAGSCVRMQEAATFRIFSLSENMPVCINALFVKIK